LPEASSVPATWTVHVAPRARCAGYLAHGARLDLAGHVDRAVDPRRWPTLALICTTPVGGDAAAVDTAAASFVPSAAVAWLTPCVDRELDQPVAVEVTVKRLADTRLTLPSRAVITPSLATPGATSGDSPPSLT